jgi:hypothetical protein
MAERGGVKMAPSQFPDGSRKRRQGDNSKARWYAIYRAFRWSDRLGFTPVPCIELSQDDLELQAYFIWLNNGGGDGHDLADWLLAIKEDALNRPVEIHRAISIDRATIWRLLKR